MTPAGTPQEQAQFIIDHAERLVRVSAMCAISFGTASGVQDTMQAQEEHNLEQARIALFDASALAAVIRTKLLLDSKQTAVSFQTVYHRLKQAEVQAELIAILSQRSRLEEIIPPTKSELIANYMEVYSKIDWAAHARLSHFRNVGLAHLLVDRLSEWITFEELGQFVSIIQQLSTILQSLCMTPTAVTGREADQYAGAVKNLIK